MDSGKWKMQSVRTGSSDRVPVSQKSVGTRGTLGTPRTFGTPGTGGTVRKALSAFQQRSAVRKHPERRNLSIYMNYIFCNTMSYIFSKFVGQGQNMTINIIVTAFRLSHTGLGQDGTANISRLLQPITAAEHQ